MNSIQLRGIKVHNLKNININIPHRKFVVISGVSGSGKSSFALDTLYAEGQRRFIESLSAYARQFLERMERPSIDSVSGMLPAIIIESKNSVTNARSTVGTQTEINDYLRLFFARLGITYCRICQKPVRKNTPTDISKKIMQLSSGAQLLITFYVDMNKESKKYLCRYLTELNKQGFTRIFLNDTIISLQEVGVERLFRDQEHIEVIVDRIIIKENIQKRLIDSLEAAYTQGKGSLQIVSLLDNGKVKRRAFSQHYNCPTCNQAYQEPNPHIFSFNSPLGACPACQGFGRIITIDKKLVVPDEAKSIAEGAIAPWTTKAGQWEFQQLIAYCRKKKISITKPFRDLKSEHKEKIFKGEKDFFGVEGFFKYLEKKVYKMHVRVFLSRYRGYTTCHCCKGSRLKDDALLVKIMGKNIHELSGMTINRLWEFFTKQLCLNSYEEKIAVTVLQEIRSRIRFLREVGLGYLTLDRLARTLSGGETQRINLASALGTNLVDTLYVLDEPSIGLHPRDNGMLINILKELKKNGNTIVVIEHDKEMISHADLVIDLGLYGGEKGGTIIYAGTVNGLKRCKPSFTGKYLRGEEKIFLHKRYLTQEKKQQHRKKTEKKSIVIHGAGEHNLKNVNVLIPLNRLVVVTGVSGSGKSTLLYDVLFNNFLRFRGRPVHSLGKVNSIEGLEHVADIVLINQTSIGRTPRSNPVTFINAFDAIRNVFAKTKSSRLRKMRSRHFSFNVEGGRCETCKGSGKIKVEMHFLADIYIECEACRGTRYKKEVLEVTHKGKNIHDVLNMTIDDALVFFEEVHVLLPKLQILRDIGLGYLKLGQPATTLSGGEAQRLKLAAQLLEKGQRNVLFLFDEPTVGLHYHDISYLMKALERLLERGNSVVMIEHNLEVIKCADYIIDLGPEGGESGGELIFSGLPQKLVKEKRSYTGRFLKDYI